MLISVVIPSRNESSRIVETVRALSRASEPSAAGLEFVIVDDASDPQLRLDSFDVDVSIQLVRSDIRLGVPQARNLGAASARGDVLVMTDAHVRFSQGWNLYAEEASRGDPIVLAATIADPTSNFRGYGCSLVVPFMGTRWNRNAARAGMPVHIPSCAGTILSRAAFDLIGGYDQGMTLYGAAEPEFGVRAWLSGVPVISIPDLVVWHRFKSRTEIDDFLSGLRPAMTHNFLRFGLLYLPQNYALQMLRYHSTLYPESFQQALIALQESDLWSRREALTKSLTRDFEWFCRTFSLFDQCGRLVVV